MKLLLRILTKFVLIAGLSSVSFASDCLTIIQPFLVEKTIPKITDKGRIGKKIEPYYLFSNRNLYPTTSLVNQTPGFHSVENFFATKFQYTVEVHSFLPDARQGKAIKNFKDDYRKFVEGNIDYVLATYQQRRDWSMNFLAEVKKQAIRDAERTQYIVVKNGMEDKQDEIWGTLKIVRSTEENKYEELLPIEDALKIRLPYNNGFKFEPGNFVVDKNHYKDAMAQLILHLSRSVKKILKEHPQIDPEADLFYTYADRESRLMYKTLGFKVTKGFESPIQKDNKDWWVLSISGKNLADLPLRLKSVRGGWEAEDQKMFDDVVALFEALKDEQVVDHNLGTKQITSNLEKRPQVVYVSRSESHLYRGEMVEKLAVYFDKFGDDGEISLPIPLDKLPLQEGSIIKFNYGTITYGKGKFIFKSELNSDNIIRETTELEIEIDPALKHPKNIKCKKVKYDEVVFDFEATF